MELSSKVRLQFGGQAYKNLGTQNIGWNRVTQDLVDNQNYAGRHAAGQSFVERIQHRRRAIFSLTPSRRLPSNRTWRGRSYLESPSCQTVCSRSRHGITTVKLPLNRIMIDEGDFTQPTTGNALTSIWSTTLSRE